MPEIIIVFQLLLITSPSEADLSLAKTLAPEDAQVLLELTNLKIQKNNAKIGESKLGAAILSISSTDTMKNGSNIIYKKQDEE